MSECSKVPQKVINEAMDQWVCLVEQAYETFGVDCDVVYSGASDASSAEITNNIPESNSINSRRRLGGLEYDFQSKTISKAGVSEVVKIRIYWDAKEWATIYGLTKVPENQVMMLTHLEHADKLSQAIKIKFTDVMGNVYIFTRVSKPVPYGFAKDKYCSSIWEQEE